MRMSFDHSRQGLEYPWILSAVVGIRILLPVPQTDSQRFRSAWGDERNLVLEASQFPQHGNNFLSQASG